MKHRFADPVKLVLLQDPSGARQAKCILKDGADDGGNAACKDSRTKRSWREY
jgi:hypothetical protein